MNKTEKFWNRVAAKPAEKPGGTPLKIISQTQEYLNPEDQLLDIGCGNGAITNQLAKSVNHVHGIDISSKMLELATEAAKQLSVRNIDYKKACLEDISAGDHSYSVVTCFSVLHYIEDTADFTRQVYQLLKPGGLFISSTPCLGEKKSLTRGLMFVLSKLKILPPIWFHDKSRLEIALAEAGFEIVEAVKISEMQEYFLVGRKRVI